MSNRYDQEFSVSFDYPVYFEAWESQWQAASAWAADKPWVVAGDPNMVIGGEHCQEFYVTWLDGSAATEAYRYLRSIDGGETWCGGKIRLDFDPNNPNDPNDLVTADFCAQPAVYQDGKLYVAYIPDRKNASTLCLNMLIPSTSAARSLSRTATKHRPVLVRPTFFAKYTASQVVAITT